jgi:NhaP-type Na+/H+ or K+/H+ antiporter
LSGATFNDLVIWTLLIAATLASMHFSGQLAERRGRSYRIWALIAGVLIGPLALPVLYLLPDRATPRLTKYDSNR